MVGNKLNINLVKSFCKLFFYPSTLSTIYMNVKLRCSIRTFTLIFSKLYTGLMKSLTKYGIYKPATIPSPYQQPRTKTAGHSRLGGVGLDAAASLQRPVLVLHGPHVPALGRRIILQLELLVLGNLLLVGSDVHTWEQEGMC